ncbi:hypothetical protein Ptc2401_00189 [Prosthecochloris sp. CIB 2401]|nr:hypothetical protein Ptc2401_00189 [Prosthecochloris sp. CIB 2401]
MPEGHQAGDDVPAFFLVDFERCDGFGACDEGVQVIQLVGQESRFVQEAEPDDLLLFAVFGESKPFAGHGVEPRHPYRPVVICQVDRDNGLDLCDDMAVENGEVLFVHTDVNAHLDELGRGEGVVAHHLPEASPEEAAGKRIFNGLQRLAGDGEVVGAVKHFHVIVIVRVEDHERRIGFQLCFGGLAVDDDFLGFMFDQLVADLTVAGKFECMLPDEVVFSRSLLLDSEPSVVDAAQEGVDAGSLKPLAAPDDNVGAACFRHDGKKIIQCGVLFGKSFEVLPDGGPEGLVTDEVLQLAKRRGTLGVADAVKIAEGLDGIAGRRGYGVCGGILVLLIGPLLANKHVFERITEERPPGHGEIREVVGKAFVEPEVIPPFHGHQVAEPHVHHLVGNGIGAVQVLAVELFIAEHVVLAEGDAADVFHGSEIEFWDEHLVVLAIRIGVVEVGFQRAHRFPGDGEDVVRIHVFRERLSAVYPKRNLVVPIFPLGVRAHNQGEKVGGKDGRSFERYRYLVTICSGVLRPGVVDIRPLRWAGYRELVRGLDVGLVEAGEQAVGVVGLEVGMHVFVTVFGIVKLVKARAGLVEHAGIGDLQHVAARSEVIFIEIDGKISLVVLLRSLAVERDRMDLFGDEIQFELPISARAVVKLHDAAPLVLGSMFFEGEFKGVAGSENQAAAGFSNVPGENVFGVYGECHEAMGERFEEMPDTGS